LIAWSTHPRSIESIAFCEYCPYGPLTVSSSNEIELDSLKSRLKISPPVELDWESARTWAPNGHYDSSQPPHATIPGKFKPGTQYRVEIAAGVR
jgi:hypothetical protein